jgi:hypothetical protein
VLTLKSRKEFALMVVSQSMENVSEPTTGGNQASDNKPSEASARIDVDRQPNSNDHSDRGNSKKETPHPLEWIIGVLLLFTLIATSVAACYTRKQWITADDQERRSLRAYVFVESATILNADGPVYTVKIRIKNTGQTPAYNVRHWLATGVAEFPEPKEGFAPPQQRTTASIDTLGSQVNSESIQSRPYKEGNRETMQTGVAALWVFGRVDYEDVFRRKCWTSYRYLVGGDMGFNGQLLAPAKAGNDADRNCDAE